MITVPAICGAPDGKFGGAINILNYGIWCRFRPSFSDIYREGFTAKEAESQVGIHIWLKHPESFHENCRRGYRKPSAKFRFHYESAGFDESSLRRVTYA